MKNPLTFFTALLLAPFMVGAAPADVRVRIDSSHYGVEYDSGQGVFTIRGKASGKTFVSSGRLEGGVGEAKAVSVTDPKFGVGQGLEVRFASGNRSLFALYPDLPFVLVKSLLRNASNEVQVLNKVGLLSAALDLGVAGDALRTLGTGGLLPPARNPGSYAFLAVAEPATRAGVVGGWLTHERGSGVVFSPVKEGVVSLQARIDYGCLRIKPGAEAETETLAIGYFDDARLGLEAYADAIAKVYSVRLPPKQTGYCTWYMEKHGGPCDEKHLQEVSAYAAKHLKPFGFDFIQIDDGWQPGKSKNGPNKNFTTHNPGGAYRSGMKAAADNITKLGLTPGIWFMPFAGTWDDPFFADRQEWFVKTLDGKPYDTAWGGTCLDMTNPAAQEYVRGVVKRIAHEWGYTLFKLDGYWTGSATKQIYVNNGYQEDNIGDAVFSDKEKTNIEALRIGTKLIREAAGPNVFLLGCCVSQNMRSFGGTFGLLDAMRVGPDTGADQIGAPHASRLWFLNGRVWWNDPDCVSVRKAVPLEQARLNASFTTMADALFYNSDWMPDFPAARLDVLRRCIPAHNLPSRPVDVFENQPATIWHLPATNRPARRDLVALYNWDRKQPLSISCPVERIGLPKADAYVGYEFWTKKFIPPFRGALSCELPRGGVARIVSVMPVTGQPVLVSTSRHITQGIADVTEEAWDTAASRLSASSLLVAEDPYEIRVVVPVGEKSWKAVKIAVSPEDAAAGVKADFTQDGPKIIASLTSPASRQVKWGLTFDQAQVSASPARAVANIKAKAEYGEITLTWDETGDEACRVTRDDGKIFTVMGNTFFDNSFAKAEAVSYTVEALNYEGKPGKSGTVRVTPAGISPKPVKPAVYLDSLKLKYVLNDYVKPSTNQNISGQPLSVGGVKYARGVGVHARSWTHCAVPTNATRFVAVVGLDDKVFLKDPRASVVFEVYGDVKEMGEEPKLLGKSPELSKRTLGEWSFDLELNSRYKELRLIVTDADDGIAADHANWVDAGFVTEGNPPQGSSVAPSAGTVDIAKRADELKSLRWGLFLCWGFSTFSGQEWRSDVKDVAYFRAKEADTDQWAQSAKEAGMGYILFRVKDQDGFCLWDTKTTDRKVTKAPLGRDVLAELRKSCDKYGVKLALCFSQGEFSQHKQCHPADGYTPAMQKAQVTELLTQYGPVEFLWFDHALGNGGLNHEKLSAFVKSLQPGCFVGFSGGDQKGADIRLDEETGEASPLADGEASGYRLATFTYPLLPAHQGGAVWYYSLPKHDKLCHPAEKVYSDYLDAVKHGTLFSLNVGPDYNGKLRAIDVATLQRVGEMIRAKAAESAEMAARKTLRKQSNSKWRQDAFMILAFGGPTNDVLADAYAKAGFNTVLTKVDQLDLCAKHGLRSVVKEATPEQVATLKDHPGVYGWWVQDEPIKKEWVNVGQMAAAFHEADPNHPAYVNLAGWENLDAYFRIVKPWFLSFDVYQWWAGEGKAPSTAAYCSELERHRVAARKAGVPLFVWVESNADWRYANGVAGAGYLTDNAAMMRNSVWLALAHGARGIQWFTAGLVFDRHGKRLRSGEDVAAINRELTALGPVLMTLRCDKVFHTKPVPQGSAAASQDFELTSTDTDLTFGLFTGPDGHRYAIVMNRKIKAGSIDEKRNITVNFKQAIDVEQFNTANGKWEPMTDKKGKGKNTLSLELLSGGGALLRCRTKSGSQ